MSSKAAEKAKKLNIIDMAVGFTAMARLLCPGSAELIKKHLGEILEDLNEVNSVGEFKKIHNNFCQWVINNITLAKKPVPPSYGQAAKIFDIVLKVYIYYCKQPNDTKSMTMIPILNSGIDTPIMSHLIKKYRIPNKISRLQQINKYEYELLQKMVRSDIKDSFADSIFPVQYDDIMWRRLNR